MSLRKRATHKFLKLAGSQAPHQGYGQVDDFRGDNSEKQNHLEDFPPAELPTGCSESSRAEVS